MKIYIALKWIFRLVTSCGYSLCWLLLRTYLCMIFYFLFLFFYFFLLFFLETSSHDLMANERVNNIFNDRDQGHTYIRDKCLKLWQANYQALSFSKKRKKKSCTTWHRRPDPIVNRKICLLIQRFTLTEKCGSDWRNYEFYLIVNIFGNVFLNTTKFRYFLFDGIMCN